MYLHLNPDNTISKISVNAFTDAIEYDKPLPSDFYNTFSKGKYLFIDGEIAVNSAWSEENGEVVSLPADVPHRTLLLNAGISSIQEIEQIEDLTTISGIGSAKAEDITNYLTNQ